VVCVGRGNIEGFAVKRPPYIAGSNLTATKARLLLMACLLRFGAPGGSSTWLDRRLAKAGRPDAKTDGLAKAGRPDAKTDGLAKAGRPDAKR
jgi:hypothetical protein